MRLVIKFAGALLEDSSTVQSLATQVASLGKQGHEILVVHGGGRTFTAMLTRFGIESKFVAGLRVTDRETRDVAVMVFAGLLNKQLSAAITAAGQPAVGISAADANAFRAEPLVHNDVSGSLGLSVTSPEPTQNCSPGSGTKALFPLPRAWGLGPTANFTTSTPTIWPPPVPNTFRPII